MDLTNEIGRKNKQFFLLSCSLGILVIATKNLTNRNGLTCNGSIYGEPKVGKMAVKATLGKKEDSIAKITRAKRDGGMAQAVAFMPSKCDALNSNPNTANKVIDLS
jgi:hypothetical protein